MADNKKSALVDGMKTPIAFRDTENPEIVRTLDASSKRDRALILKMRTAKKIIVDPENKNKLIEGGLRWEQISGSKADVSAPARSSSTARKAGQTQTANTHAADIDTMAAEADAILGLDGGGDPLQED